jgi:hypothetical protein
MTTTRFLTIFGLLALTGACGGDDDGEGTGFLLRAKVRGINYFAMSQLQVRFEATGDDHFGSTSGEEHGLDYETQDGGRAFVATGGRNWVTQNYEQTESEFVFEIPFVNPAGGGDVNVQVLIHREVPEEGSGDFVLVGESALTPTQLPTAPGGEVEVVVGCVAGAPCNEEVPET